MEPSKVAWHAGTAKAAKAAGIAIALCASLAAHCAPSAGIELIADPTQAVSLAHGMGKKNAFEASDSMRAAVSAILAKHSGLPSAQIAVIAASRNDEDGRLMAGTSAWPSLNGAPDCPIVVATSFDGASQLASSLAADMGAKPGKALEARLMEFELLHELGHCAQAQKKAEFSHPGLGDEQNKAIALALRGQASLGDVWQESFGDSYAMIKILEATQGDSKKLSQALADGRLIKAWRQMGRDGHERPRPDGTLALVFGNDNHLTEAALGELLAHPKKWMDSSTSPEARAAQLASIGLATSAKAGADMDLISAMVFEPRERVLAEMMPAANMLASKAEFAHKVGATKEAFMLGAGKIASFYFDAAGTNPFGKAAAAHCKELAGLVFDESALGASPAQTASKALAAAKSNGLADKAAFEAIGVDPMALKMADAWSQAISAQPKALFAVEPAGPEAIKAIQAQGAAQAQMIKSFFEDPSKLSRWRSAKPASQAAQAKPTAGGFSYE